MILLLLSILSNLSAWSAPRSCEELELLRLPQSEIQGLLAEVCDLSDEDNIDGPNFRPEFQTGYSLIYEYTARCYRPVNTALRLGPGKANPKALQLAEQIQIAYCSEPKFEGPVYRGTDLPANVIEQFKLEGSQIRFDAFTSSSKMPNVACQFVENILFVIHSKNGKVVSESFQPDESEVTFMPGTDFKIIKYHSAQTGIYEKFGCKSNKKFAVVVLQEI